MKKETKPLTHQEITSKGGKSSWKSRTKGKTKKQIKEMMQKLARKRYKKLSTYTLAK